MIENKTTGCRDILKSFRAKHGPAHLVIGHHRSLTGLESAHYYELEPKEQMSALEGMFTVTNLGGTKQSKKMVAAAASAKVLTAAA